MLGLASEIYVHENDVAKALNQQSPTPTVEDDARLFGTGFEKVMPDGTRERIDPANIFIGKDDTERERCAKIAEGFKPNLDDPRSNQEQLAALIRGHS